MSEPYRFNFMHFMPYIYLPENHKEYKSLWVDFPNKYYDPQKAQGLYARYLKELVLADELGFDAVVVNEHHNTSYSMMANPNLIAAALVNQIKKAKICVWGTPPNLTYPNRLAEEYAMIDVMSGGRLEVAFPLGTGMEYWANPINPASARSRHKESIKIILQAWTQDGPTKFTGEHYAYRYLNPWPRPWQKPHPPCYIVGTGSPETVELAAELGFGYSAVFIPRTKALALNNKLRERAQTYGNTIRGDQLPILTHVYVAETQEQAEREFIDHHRFYFEDGLRTTSQFLSPPGYLSVAEMKVRMGMGDKMHGAYDFKTVRDTMFIAVGTADHVASKFQEWSEMMGSRHFNMNFHLGDMPHWKVVKNLSLFAEEVMPKLRASSAERATARA